MLAQSEQIKALKKVFDKAKSAPRDEDGCFLGLRLRGSLFSAMYNVGDKKNFELKEEAHSYLKDPFSECREEAIRTLGGYNGLHLEEFKDEVYKIWLNDPDKYVKSAAISAWGSYYVGTKDSIVLKVLYNIFKSEKYSIDARTYTLYWFMQAVDEVSCYAEGIDLLNFDEIYDQKEFTKNINWGKVQRILRQYVPGGGEDKLTHDCLCLINLLTPILALGLKVQLLQEKLSRMSKLKDLHADLVREAKCQNGPNKLKP